MQITLEQLRKICPNAPKNLDVFIPHLNNTMNKYEINTKNRIAMFIAQIAHESGQFKYTRELSSGKQYEGRKDLGNTHAGDGAFFRGRGLIQCTGRINYANCSQALFGDYILLQKPQLLETPQYATLSAGWFWNLKNLNIFADLPDTWRSKTKGYTPFQYVTYLINGGQNGIAEREKFYNIAKAVFV